MKKNRLLALCMALVMTFTLVGCGDKKPDTEEKPVDSKREEVVDTIPSTEENSNVSEDDTIVGTESSDESDYNTNIELETEYVANTNINGLEVKSSNSSLIGFNKALLKYFGIRDAYTRMDNMGGKIGSNDIYFAVLASEEQMKITNGTDTLEATDGNKFLILDYAIYNNENEAVSIKMDGIKLEYKSGDWWNNAEETFTFDSLENYFSLSSESLESKKFELGKLVFEVPMECTLIDEEYFNEIFVSISNIKINEQDIGNDMFYIELDQENDFGENLFIKSSISETTIPENIFTNKAEETAVKFVRLLSTGDFNNAIKHVYLPEVEDVFINGLDLWWGLNRNINSAYSIAAYAHEDSAYPVYLEDGKELSLIPVEIIYYDLEGYEAYLYLNLIYDSETDSYKVDLIFGDSELNVIYRDYVGIYTNIGSDLYIDGMKLSNISVEAEECTEYFENDENGESVIIPTKKWKPQYLGWGPKEFNVKGENIDATSVETISYYLALIAPEGYKIEEIIDGEYQSIDVKRNVYNTEELYNSSLDKDVYYGNKINEFYEFYDLMYNDNLILNLLTYDESTSLEVDGNVIIAEEGKKFGILEVALHNLTSESQAFNYSDVILIDDEVEYKPSINSLSNIEVPADSNLHAYIIYDIELDNIIDRLYLKIEGNEKYIEPVYFSVLPIKGLIDSDIDSYLNIQDKYKSEAGKVALEFLRLIADEDFESALNYLYIKDEDKGFITADDLRSIRFEKSFYNLNAAYPIVENNTFIEKIEDASINEWVVVEYGGYNDFLEVVSFDKYDPDDADDNCRLYMVFDESSGTYKVDMIYHHPIIATSHSSNNVYYDYYYDKYVTLRNKTIQILTDVNAELYIDNIKISDSYKIEVLDGTTQKWEISGLGLGYKTFKTVLNGEEEILYDDVSSLGFFGSIELMPGFSKE